MSERRLLKPEGEHRPGDIAAGIVQIVGGTLALVGLPFLYGRLAIHPSPLKVVVFSLYGACILYFFVIAALAHLLARPVARKVFGRLDDAGSLFIIAGSSTPICLLSFPGALGWIVLTALWGFAILDFLLTLFYFGRLKDLGLAAYYIVFTLVLPLIQPFRGFIAEAVEPWLLLAGLLFSSGLIFRSREGMPYHHAIWHVFMLAALVVQFFAVGALA
jgi:hemolysin III